MADFIVISGRILQVLLNGVALISGQMAHPNLLLIYRRQPVPPQAAVFGGGHVDAPIQFSDIVVFRLQDDNGLVVADVEAPIIMGSADVPPFSAAGGNPISLFSTVRRRLAPVPTSLLRFIVEPLIPAELNIGVYAILAEHLPLVTLRVEQLGHVIPNLRRPHNGLTPRIGIGAARLLIYLREMSESYRDGWGDRYRLGRSDPALQLQVASNGHWVTLVLGNVVRTLWHGAYEFFVEARPDEHFHLWETSFNFQRFYTVVLHAATQLCHLQPTFCVWVAREAMWFDHHGSRQSFFLYDLP